MRYSLLLSHSEAAAGDVSDEDMTSFKEAFGAYARSLDGAGVLRSADVLRPSSATTTITSRTGTLQVQDGPFADTKEALAGIFIIDVEDLDAALAWAEQCPGAQYGVVEIRPTATAFLDGRWN